MNYIIMGNHITCSIKNSLPPLQKKLFLTKENVVSGVEDMTQDTDLWVSGLKLCYLDV